MDSSNDSFPSNHFCQIPVICPFLFSKGAPRPPTDLVVKDVTSTSVTLSWTPPTSDALSYVVHYKLANQDGTVHRQETTVTVLEVTNLNVHTSYEFWVVARNNFGQSDPSDAAQVMTQPPG